MLNKLRTYLFNEPLQTKEISWFKNALALFLIYKSLVYLYLFQELFSNASLIDNRPVHIGFINDGAFWLSNHFSPAAGLVFIALLLIISFLSLFNVSNYLLRFVLWLVVVNLNNYLYPTLAAGDLLLNQLLFFHIFFTNKKHTSSFFQELTIALHNTALIGIKVQVCLLYFLAGLFKLEDADWMSGIALYQVVHIPEYSNELLMLMPEIIAVVITYATMAYQITFPITISIKPLKKYVFAFGMTQHLIIALCMGLFSFGVIMMISYLLFLKHDTTRKISA